MVRSLVKYDPNNVFSRIISGALPSYKIFETDACLAILDAFPAVPGHSLLISKAPVATVADLDESQAAQILKELPRLCRAVQANGGAAAGQMVFHLHFHVVPRFAGDGLFAQFSSSKEMIAPDAASAMLAKLQSELQKESNDNRG